MVQVCYTFPMFEQSAQNGSSQGSSTGSSPLTPHEPLPNANPPVVSSLPPDPPVASPVDPGVAEASQATPPGQPSGFDSLGAPTGPAIPPTISPTLADQETVDMFQRAGLSSMQKMILFFVVSVIIAIFIGVGIWLYFTLQPFSGVVTNTSLGTNDTNSTTGQTPGDPDGDGLFEVDEIKFGTDPNNPDTDGDGLSDYDEVKIYNTDPNNPDTDGDGYNDNDEVVNGYNPNGPGRL